MQILKFDKDYTVHSFISFQYIEDISKHSIHDLYRIIVHFISFLVMLICHLVYVFILTSVILQVLF